MRKNKRIIWVKEERKKWSFAFILNCGNLGMLFPSLNQLISLTASLFEVCTSHGSIIVECSDTLTVFFMLLLAHVKSGLDSAHRKELEMERLVPKWEFKYQSTCFPSFYVNTRYSSHSWEDESMKMRFILTVTTKQKI